jgi:hypothetical protein
MFVSSQLTLRLFFHQVTADRTTAINFEAPSRKNKKRKLKRTNDICQGTTLSADEQQQELKKLREIMSDAIVLSAISAKCTTAHVKQIQQTRLTLHTPILQTKTVHRLRLQYRV